MVAPSNHLHVRFAPNRYREVANGAHRRKVPIPVVRQNNEPVLLVRQARGPQRLRKRDGEGGWDRERGTESMGAEPGLQGQSMRSNRLSFIHVPCGSKRRRQ
jgi:hypothetical protein